MIATLAAEFESEAEMFTVLNEKVLNAVGWPRADVREAIQALNIGPRDFASGDRLKAASQRSARLLKYRLAVAAAQSDEYADNEHLCPLWVHYVDAAMKGVPLSTSQILGCVKYSKNKGLQCVGWLARRIQSKTAFRPPSKSGRKPRRRLGHTRRRMLEASRPPAAAPLPPLVWCRCRCRALLLHLDGRSGLARAAARATAAEVEAAVVETAVETAVEAAVCGGGGGGNRAGSPEPLWKFDPRCCAEHAEWLLEEKRATCDASILPGVWCGGLTLSCRVVVRLVRRSTCTLLT